MHACVRVPVTKSAGGPKQISLSIYNNLPKAFSASMCEGERVSVRTQKELSTVPNQVQGLTEKRPRLDLLQFDSLGASLQEK